ncbi:class I adenylate-forming enzyme family protein [Blastococcus deserti]|uniref:Class I adenylate-forming enzyme family protein n=1 Tax=Blastococcus deserti TaxID=2259033 RepID=A0ABW4XGQ9_9ACTN
MDTSMAAVLARAYARYPRSTAVTGAAHAVTFADLRERVLRVGAALVRLGTEPGDRVVLWLDNGQEFLEVEQAAFLCGFVRTALSPRLHVDDVLRIVDDCAPRVVVTDASRADQLVDRLPDGMAEVVVVGGGRAPRSHGYERLLASAAPAAPLTAAPAPTDLAALLYTSGTTGAPKAAMLTHRNWVAMISGLMAELPAIDHTDVVLHAGPMAHLSGSIGTACYARGAATATLTRFDPATTLRTVQELGVTVLPLVPTMLTSLTAEAETGRYDLSSLRAVPYGGSAISAEAARRAHARFGEVLVQVYGLSEALVPLAALPPAAHRSDPGDPVPRRLGSAGRPTPFVDLRLVSEEGVELSEVGERGEIQVRGGTVMQGYWRRPEQTEGILRPDGWLDTGDIGYRDEEGYLYIVDRKGDAIISGGINVYPAEVEKVISLLPEVHEVVVVGAPHEKWGETVTAVVALKPGRTLAADRVVDICRQHLAGYKKPTAVHFVDALPKTSNGKLWRRQVRDRFWAGRDRQVGA